MTRSRSDLHAYFVAYGRDIEGYLARQVRCPHTAADLKQEAFLRLAQSSHEIGDVRAFLYRVARNLAVDHFRKARRQRTEGMPEEEMAGIPDRQPLPEEAVDAQERITHLYAAIAQLPDRTRQIFLLNRVEGLTYAEVAARLRVSDSTVQKHLARALLHVMRAATPRNN